MESFSLIKHGIYDTVEEKWLFVEVAMVSHIRLYDEPYEFGYVDHALTAIWAFKWGNQ